jgi:protein TonB
VNSRVEIPVTELGSDISRTVLVEFTVNVDGTLSEIHAVFGSNPVLNEAAENAVAKSPKWEPGELKGEKRSVRLTVPVVFENQ